MTRIDISCSPYASTKLASNRPRRHTLKSRERSPQDWDRRAKLTKRADL